MILNHFRESDTDSVKRRGTCVEPTYSMEGGSLDRLSQRTGTAAAVAAATLTNRQTPTAMVPMLYATEERSAKRRAMQECEMVSC